MNPNLSDPLTNYCSECGGSGYSYADKENQFYPIKCPTCKGTGRTDLNKLNLFKLILIVLLLIGLGFTICKFLNL